MFSPLQPSSDGQGPGGVRHDPIIHTGILHTCGCRVEKSPGPGVGQGTALGPRRYKATWNINYR